MFLTVYQILTLVFHAINEDITLHRGNHGNVVTNQAAVTMAIKLRDLGNHFHPCPAMGNGLLNIIAPGGGIPTLRIGACKVWPL